MMRPAERRKGEISIKDQIAFLLWRHGDQNSPYSYSLSWIVETCA
jgi:hypothetical protein